MAATIPAKLKTADVQRFATRAAQLEKYRPVVSYWLEYFILQIILNKQLHTTDDEVQNYAIELMDKLEAYKSANATNDAVVDDVAAKAYMEEFGLETFERAEKAQRENKVTRATADTFQAAATFLDVQTIWAPLEGECAAKSKFAKFHALRIAKALKAGEDPNATNPVVEEPAKPTTDEEGIEAELKELEGYAPAPGQGSNLGVYKSPTAETVPNSVQPSRPQSALQGGLASPPVLPAQNINEPPTHQPEISPVGSTDASAARNGSIGGGYFPSVPSGTSEYKPPTVEVGMPHDTDMDVDNDPPSAPPADPSSFYTSQPNDSLHPAATPLERPSAPTPNTASLQTPFNPSVQAPGLRSPFTPSVFSHASQPQFTPQPPPAPGPPAGGYNTDDESVMAAQKHAKWAISALNFEDVPTAVKELRIALQALGVS
jgi:vacuolar protein sorting-associated protein VTA1